MSPTLTIHLDAITANWRMLRAQFTGDECAAVVKADAYGLGMVRVAKALSSAGCHTFCVATVTEALGLRKALPDVRILVFHGIAEGEEFACAAHRIVPVLNSAAQLERWRPIAAQHAHAVSALHIDTGMGRLGLQPDAFTALLQQHPKLLEEHRVGLVMSHLACASEPDHSLNPQQLALFSAACAQAPGIPASLCNSAGILLGKEYHFHLARPGCALYGIAPQYPRSAVACALKHVATWEAPILQIRTLERAQTLGYGATTTAPQGARIATVESGYADGYLRHLSNAGCGYIGDYRVPLVGRVTMDMLCFDVSAVPQSKLDFATHITLLGDRDGIRVDDLASAAQTIGYEIFSRIGPRVKRIYA